MADAASPTLAQVVAALSELYDDAGVMLWLTSSHDELRSKPDGNWACTPQQYIAAGHIEEVADLVHKISERKRQEQSS